MPDDTPAPAPAVTPAKPAVPAVNPVKKCPGCGHNVGTPHDKNCIYGGIVEDANAF